MAAPLAYFIGDRWFERLLLWLALSAGAILLERLAPERTVPLYSLDEEDSNVLRQEQTTDSEDQREPSAVAR
jgi:hypothetical protein